MEKIIFRRQVIKGLPGYEIKIADQSASVQDLLDGLNVFIINGKLERLWPEKQQDCCGCDLCCHEPLPVTSIDVANICQARGISLVKAFQYLWVQAERNVADITLKRGKNQRCVFLQANGLCSIYMNRPFLCQTYICCQTTAVMEELRSQVVNQGMDELIRLSIEAFQKTGSPLPVNRSRNPRIDLQDWTSNIFTGKNSYSQILLKGVLSSDLFKQMLL